VEGKGRDLRGVIHEWAGLPAEVERLVRAVAARRGGELLVLSPECVAAPVAGKSHVGSLAMFRALRPERLGASDARELFGDAERCARLPVYVWGLDSV
jgi:hypothetical protein